MNLSVHGSSHFCLDGLSQKGNSGVLECSSLQPLMLIVMHLILLCMFVLLTCSISWVFLIQPSEPCCYVWLKYSNSIFIYFQKHFRSELYWQWKRGIKELKLRCWSSLYRTSARDECVMASNYQWNELWMHKPACILWVCPHPYFSRHFSGCTYPCAVGVSTPACFKEFQWLYLPIYRHFILYVFGWSFFLSPLSLCPNEPFWLIIAQTLVNSHRVSQI